MILLTAPATEGREASPIALVIILILVVAVILLIRSMNKHLRKVPPTFTDRDAHGSLRQESRADPAGTDPADPGRP